MLGGVFNSGILATGPIPENAKYNYTSTHRQKYIDKVAKDRAGDQSPRCGAADVAAMHFCLGHPAVATIVLGAVKPDEVRTNAAALRQTVPPALWADLKAEGLLDKSAPTPSS